MKKRHSLTKTLIGGVVCITALTMASGASAAVRNLFIAATDGYMYVPDHNGYIAAVPPDPTAADTPYRKVYIRGFCDDTPAQTATPGCANMPAPIIDVNQGDDVFITLRNLDNANPVAPKDPHTIHLHGMHVTTQNDGFNETSWEVPEAATGLPNQGTYYFKAQKPGSYMWHCHVEASEHIEMGMYGAMIIRPVKRGRPRPNRVYGFDNDRFDREYIVLLSSLDVEGHDAIQTDFNSAMMAGLPNDPAVTGTDPAAIDNYNFAAYQPEYWLVNGRAFPDTLLPTYDPAVCNADPLRSVDYAASSDFPGCNPAASGPPSGFLTGSNNMASYQATVEADWNQRVLMRIINMGYAEVPWHIHGAHFSIIGKDANPYNSDDQKREQYTVHVGSGETYDVILPTTSLARDAAYSVTTPNGGGVNEFGELWGAIDPLTVDNNVTDQWYPAHSHNDYTVTNNGLYPGGQAQLIHIAPGL